MTVIHKTPEDWRVVPHLTDYEQTRAAFRWSTAPNPCVGMPSGGCSSNPTSSRSERKMMTQDDIRTEVLSVLTTIAPEVEADDIREDVLLRDQVDLDSMDWLNFLIGIHKRLQVDIPESDYASLRTLTDVVRYVEQHATA
jgi:acyl carrier protein